jgi:hypothetical protein
MKKKFPVLHVIVWIFRVLGALVLITALIAGIAGMVTGFTRGFGMMDRYGYGGMMGFGGGFGILFSGLLSGIFLYGAGEVIALLLAIEENTRSSQRITEVKQELPVAPPANPS